MNGVLTLVDEEVKVKRPVTERIKTSDDAMDELGEEHTLVRQFKDLYENHLNAMIPCESADITAYLQLRIIAAALNEGWKPQLTDGEYRWYPWFYLYTQQEIDKMSDKERRRCVLRSGVLSNASGGLAYANASNASSCSNTFYGARLAFKSKELAAYAGMQFIEIWADFYFKPQEKKA